MKFYHLSMLVSVLGLGACAHYEPFEPVSIDEIPERPRLLSGEDGEFIFIS